MKTRRPKSVRSAREPLRLECLESRMPLAGNVTAQLVGSTLLLTGDALGNEIAVASVAGGKVAVLGNGTSVNGSAAAFVTTKAVTNVVANLDGGNDFAWFGNDAQGFANQLASFGVTPAPFTPSALQSAIDVVSAGATAFALPGNLTVTTADGNDIVCLIGTVGGSVAVNLGSALPGSGNFNGFLIGDDTVQTVANSVGGALTVVGGAQDDGVSISGTNVGGRVSLALGNGDNRATVLGFGATFGSFGYTGGQGADYVFVLNRITVRNGVRLFTGPQGEDLVMLNDGANVGGSVVINTGAGGDDDEILVNATTIRRNLSVTTGAGADQISIAFNTIGGATAIASGASADIVAVIGPSVGLSTTINAGDGNDTVDVVDVTSRSNLVVALGAGNDLLTVNGTTAPAAFLYGGSGTNTLNIDAASATGIRRVRSYQFQTVNRGGTG